jgi:alkanesulfonate monooxygenase SsuD/methylene tetrahydromethanopterin reductase-like flavin-dependent oxidoreductase (luciferase family)
MKVSLCVDPGWHAVYVCDHFMPHDPAALAARTARVAVGSLVLGNTYRHPAVVANMAATLDRISQGRLVLGIGAGWQPNEHAAYGIALPARQDRIAALDEACAVIRSLLDQRRTTMEGAAYRLSDAPCDPKPTSRVGLLVGGGGPGIMRVAARHADVWHAWAGPAEFADKNALLDGLCRDAGRQPSDVARACGGAVTVRPGPGTVGTAGEGDVRGTPQEVLSQLLALRAAGADEFIVSDDAANVPMSEALEQIDIMTEGVLPAL